MSILTLTKDISQKLGGSTSQTFWAGTSYLLTSAVSQPVIAMLSEFLGSYILTATALVLFAAGSITCAIASSFSVLLTGRFIQGVGGGGIIALVQIICAEMIPLRHRPRWFSIILLSWAIGTIAGPFLGSGFVEVSSFRWVFWINVPVCCLGVIILLVGATQLDGGAVTMEGLSRVDWVGCCLFILSTSGFLVGISWGGIQFKWNSYQTLVPIICSTCGLLSLVVWERKYAPFPFIRPSLFQSKSLCAAYLGAFLHGLIVSDPSAEEKDGWKYVLILSTAILCLVLCAFLFCRRTPQITYAVGRFHFANLMLDATDFRYHLSHSEPQR